MFACVERLEAKTICLPSGENDGSALSEWLSVSAVFRRVLISIRKICPLSFPVRTSSTYCELSGDQSPCPTGKGKAISFAPSASARYTFFGSSSLRKITFLPFGDQRPASRLLISPFARR